MANQNKWLIIIWHQANDANTFYALADNDDDAALLFDTEREAKEY
jgi:hypothetical protein